MTDRKNEKEKGRPLKGEDVEEDCQEREIVAHVHTLTLCCCSGSVASVLQPTLFSFIYLPRALYTVGTAYNIVLLTSATSVLFFLMEYKTFTHLVYEVYPFLTKVQLNPQNLKKNMKEEHVV